MWGNMIHRWFTQDRRKVKKGYLEEVILVLILVLIINVLLWDPVAGHHGKGSAKGKGKGRYPPHQQQQFYTKEVMYRPVNSSGNKNMAGAMMPKPNGLPELAGVSEEVPSGNEMDGMGNGDTGGTPMGNTNGAPMVSGAPAQMMNGAPMPGNSGQMPNGMGMMMNGMMGPGPGMMGRLSGMPMMMMPGMAAAIPQTGNMSSVLSNPILGSLLGLTMNGLVMQIMMGLERLFNMVTESISNEQVLPVAGLAGAYILMNLLGNGTRSTLAECGAGSNNMKEWRFHATRQLTPTPPGNDEELEEKFADLFRDTSKGSFLHIRRSDPGLNDMLDQVNDLAPIDGFYFSYNPQHIRGTELLKRYFLVQKSPWEVLYLARYLQKGRRVNSKLLYAAMMGASMEREDMSGYPMPQPMDAMPDRFIPGDLIFSRVSTRRKKAHHKKKGKHKKKKGHKGKKGKCKGKRKNNKGNKNITGNKVSVVVPVVPIVPIIPPGQGQPPQQPNPPEQPPPPPVDLPPPPEPPMELPPPPETPVDPPAYPIVPIPPSYSTRPTPTYSTPPAYPIPTDIRLPRPTHVIQPTETYRDSLPTVLLPPQPLSFGRGAKEFIHWPPSSMELDWLEEVEISQTPSLPPFPLTSSSYSTQTYDDAPPPREPRITINVLGRPRVVTGEGYSEDGLEFSLDLPPPPQPSTPSNLGDEGDGSWTDDDDDGGGSSDWDYYYSSEEYDDNSDESEQLEVVQEDPQDNQGGSPQDPDCYPEHGHKRRKKKKKKKKERSCGITINEQVGADENGAENLLWYFREDMMLNQHYWYWSQLHPPNSTHHGDRRGELSFFMHRSIIARYNAERLSNGLGRVLPFQFQFGGTIPEGYDSHLADLSSGEYWTPRMAATPLQDIFREGDPDFGGSVFLSSFIASYEALLAGIRRGMLVGQGRSPIPTNNMAGIDSLANALEGSDLAAEVYRPLNAIGHLILGLASDPDYEFQRVPGVLADAAVALRDPLFYSYHLFMDNLLELHKQQLPPYRLTGGDFPLLWRGVEISEVELQRAGGGKPNSLRTFWAHHKFEMAPGLEAIIGKKELVQVCAQHLDHEPFHFRIVIERKPCAKSRTARATIRIFMAPRFDERQVRIPLDAQRRLMFPLDSFPVKLKVGRNTIIRRAVDSALTRPWSPNIYGMDEREDNRGWEWGSEEPPNFCGCGWPQHLFIPKGSALGTDFDLFIMVTNYDDDYVPDDPELAKSPVSCNSPHLVCGMPRRRYPDKRPMGYPFDRPVSRAFTCPTGATSFTGLACRVLNSILYRRYDTLEQYVGGVPNMAMQQVTIRHMDAFLPEPRGH